MSTKSDIEQLNSFLRGEQAAVETYQQCIDKIDAPTVLKQLKSLQLSHQSRVTMLRERILSLGGIPSKDAGLWGGVAKMVEGGAAVLGEGAAISALEEGEDHGLKGYQEEVAKLSMEEKLFVQEQLLPKQLHTHRVLSEIDESH